MSDDRILPQQFRDVTELEEFMTRPSAELVSDLARIDGDIMVLGVGGKMGPTLARMAKRAAPDKRVIGVARFSEPSLIDVLKGHGVECIACDLLDRDALERLPNVKDGVRNIVFMAGHKFGAADNASLTWMMNVGVPMMVAETFREARIVAFSTACVYPFVPVDGPGASEAMPATPPSGDYANSCVGRERMFEFGSRKYGTAGRSVRLSYAIDTRYGVLHDVATAVQGGVTLDLSMGHADVIWQGDANEQSL
jgi:nucleoside-diphosphate-sugar epimerase